MLDNFTPGSFYSGLDACDLEAKTGEAEDYIIHVTCDEENYGSPGNSAYVVVSGYTYKHARNRAMVGASEYCNGKHGV